MSPNSSRTSTLQQDYLSDELHLSSFHHALQTVADAHAKEVSLLQIENSNLRAQLGMPPSLVCKDSLHRTNGSKEAAFPSSDTADVEEARHSDPSEARVPSIQTLQRLPSRRSVRIPSKNSTASSDFGEGIRQASAETSAREGKREAAKHGTWKSRRVSKSATGTSNWKSPVRMASKNGDSFELRTCWSQILSSDRTFRRLGGTLHMAQVLKSSTKSESVIGGQTRRLVLHPNSFKRLVWDLTSMVLLAYDIMMVPFAGAFNPPSSPLMTVMTWSTTREFHKTPS
jgi:hypothetical protein